MAPPAKPAIRLDRCRAKNAPTNPESHRRLRLSIITSPSVAEGGDEGASGSIVIGCFPGRGEARGGNPNRPPAPPPRRFRRTGDPKCRAFLRRPPRATRALLRRRGRLP